MFDVRDSRDFYQKLDLDLAEFQASPLSSRAAINCALTAYHLHEWIWGDWLKRAQEVHEKLGITDKRTFLAWIDQNCPWFEAVQDVANGSKHFGRQSGQRAKAIGTDDQHHSPSGHAPDVPRLEIEVASDGKTAWIDASIVFEDIATFWRDFLLQYSPYTTLPIRQAHYTEFK
jgi:hypothetical protein